LSPVLPSLVAKQRKRSVDEPGLNPPLSGGCLAQPCGDKTANKMKGIIGKKIGMTSIFDSTGKQTACTIIEAGPCVVTQVKTQDTDGYSALQLAYGDKKEKHTIGAEKNHYAKANTSAKKTVKEFRNYYEKKILVIPLLLKFSLKAKKLK